MVPYVGAHNPQRIREARSRCEGCPNVSLHHCSGRDHTMFDSGTFDRICKVTIAPYAFQAGLPPAEKHVSKARSVMKPAGDFLILKFRYHRDLKSDQRNKSRLGAVEQLIAQRATVSLRRQCAGAVVASAAVP